MILPDVNVLVYAHRREADDHEAYAAWLRTSLGGDEELALVDAVLTGFVRIVTNPRIFVDPTPTSTALEFVGLVRASPLARTSVAGESAWGELGRLAERDRALRGNLVPDAWLAAIASTTGARVATADAGFARFGVAWFDPLVAAR